ncbi:MAG: FAD-dependent monooxygenase [Pseudomonadota bacterium]
MGRIGLHADPGRPRQAARRLRRFHPEVQQVIDAIPEASRWPILERTAVPLWSRGRVVMLGDACHAMAPHMGQGAPWRSRMPSCWCVASIAAAPTIPPPGSSSTRRSASSAPRACSASRT